PVFDEALDMRQAARHAHEALRSKQRTPRREIGYAMLAQEGLDLVAGERIAAEYCLRGLLRARGHPNRHTMTLAEPRSETKVIGMHVSDEHALERLVCEDIAFDLFPGVL